MQVCFGSILTKLREIYEVDFSIKSDQWPMILGKKLCGKMKCIIAQCEAASGNLQQPRKEKVVTSVKEAVEVITIISLLASRPSSTKQPPVF